MGDVTNDPFCSALTAEPSKSGGIDFHKLNTPEAREAATQHRLEIEARLTAKQASQKRMADYLMRQVEEGEIDNAWECEFIASVYQKTQTVLPFLSEKQDTILTRLFEKY
jgi:hypothetical protein